MCEIVEMLFHVSHNKSVVEQCCSNGTVSVITTHHDQICVYKY